MQQSRDATKIRWKTLTFYFLFPILLLCSQNSCFELFIIDSLNTCFNIFKSQTYKSILDNTIKPDFIRLDGEFQELL